MYRFSVDGLDLEPSNIGDIGIAIELQRDFGAFQFVYSLSEKIEFGKTGYDIIINYGECQKIPLLIYEQCENIEYLIFEGYFTIRDAEIDPDLEIIKIEPKQDSQYKCVLDNIDREFNFLEEPDIVSANFVTGSEIEWLFELADEDDIPFWGTEVDCGTPFSPFLPFKLFAREKKVTFCNGQNPIPPTGTGWQLFSNTCQINNRATWVRKPLVFDPPLVCSDFATSTCTPIGCTPPVPASPNGEVWLKIKNLTNTATNEEIGYWINLNSIQGEFFDLNNGRNLVDVIEFALNKFCPNLTLQSNFLRQLVNPVTGQNPSKTQGLQLHAISDIKDPNASEPATVERITLKTLLEDICVNRFNCFWRVDEGTQKLIIEHISDIFVYNNTDLTAIDSGKWLERKNKYLYDKSFTPIEEQFQTLDQGIDFTGVPISYENGCASGVETYNSSTIFAEVKQIVESPDEFQNEGVVLICPDSLIPVGYTTYSSAKSEKGALTGIYEPNVAIGYANLQEAFWVDFRPFESGIMNDVFTSFNGVKVRELDEIEVPWNCLFDFQPYSLFTINASNEAELVSATYNLQSKFLELKLRY